MISSFKLSLTSLSALIASFPLAAFAQEPAAPPVAETAPAVDASASVETPPASTQPAATPEPAPTAPAAMDPGPTEAAQPPTQPVLPPPAPPAEDAPSLTPLKITTSTWTRFEGRANYDTLGVSRGRFQEGDAFFFRARLGIQTNPLQLTPDLKGLVQFTPQASGKFGLNNTLTEPNVGIYEGYFRLEGTGATFDAGRFMMNYGDALVIGNLDWSHTGRAFDGARVRLKLDKAFVDAFATLTAPDGISIAEGHPLVSKPFMAGDSYFWGVYAGLGPLLAEGLDLDGYLLGVSTVEASGLPNAIDPTTPVSRGGATELTLGGRVKQKLGAFDYRLEAGLQVGDRPVVRAVTLGAPAVVQALAYQVDGEVGYSFTPKFRLGLNGVVASGDNPDTPENEAWHQLYPTGHKFLGLMDVIGDRTNVASAVLKASLGVTDSLKAVLDAHLFARLQNGGLGQVAAPATTKFSGYEFDAQLIQKLGAPGYVRGLYGLFIPNSGHFVSNELAHYVEVEGGITF